MSRQEIDKYVYQFTNLSNRDRAHDYESTSIRGAPHQPLLLLAVLDLYAQTATRHNFIEIGGSLVELWKMYLQLLQGPSRLSPVAMPIYALRNEPFWHLVPKPGAPTPKGRVRTTARFYQFFIGVTLDDGLHEALTQKASRSRLRRALIGTYFLPEHWLSLDQSLLPSTTDALAPSAYAERLLAEQAFGRFVDQPSDLHESRTLRDIGFRKAVTFAYDYRCAFCGVRLRGSQNRVSVEAAHIVPWSETRDDRPVNGLCLCPLCHWAFDARMLAIDLSGTILTHVKIQSGDNLPGHLSTLNCRSMFPPREEKFRPDPHCVREQLRRFRAA